MKRFHAHISVSDLNASIRFYSAMFGIQPTVLKPDYAKWSLEDPRVNFAVSQRGAAAGLNHLGIQVESAGELAEMHRRLESLPDVTEESGAACCYAKSDKYWANDPEGITWETFHTLDETPVYGAPKQAEAACCIPLARAGNDDGPCCLPQQESKSGKCC